MVDARMDVATGSLPGGCARETEPSPADLVALRRLVASAVRAFAAWLSARDARVLAGDGQASGQMYRSTLRFLRECRLDGEPYDPDWAAFLERA